MFQIVPCGGGAMRRKRQNADKPEWSEEKCKDNIWIVDDGALELVSITHCTL